MIALPNEEDEIPDEPERGWRSRKKILDIAGGEYEIPLEDIVIDPLAMPIGADTTLVKKTLRTIELIHDELGLNMTLGAVATSRSACPAAPRWARRSCRWRCSAGLTSAIMDVRTPQIVEAVKAADLLLGNDEWGAAWIARSRAAAGGGEGRSGDRPA